MKMRTLLAVIVLGLSCGLFAGNEVLPDVNLLNGKRDLNGDDVWKTFHGTANFFLQKGMGASDSQVIFATAKGSSSLATNTPLQAEIGAYVVNPKVQWNYVRHAVWYAEPRDGDAADILINNILYPVADAAIDACWDVKRKTDMTEDARLILAASLVRTAHISYKEGWSGMNKNNAVKFGGDVAFQILSEAGEKHIVKPLVKDAFNDTAFRGVLEFAGQYALMAGLSGAINYCKKQV
jgi:hypothetical protein